MKLNWLFPILIIALLLAGCKNKCCPSDKKTCQNKNKTVYQTGELLFEDDFSNNLDNYILEYPNSPNSEIKIIDNKLVVDVDGGATVWYKNKLKGDFLIEYKRLVAVDSGKNDRLSDLNQFWMAGDPRNENLFTRSGVFREYDSLQMYYFGFGGNTNSTTRFRKYNGNGDRVLIYDYKDEDRLLLANKEYSIKIIVFDSTTTLLVDNKEMFTFKDSIPIKEGYFGFRTTESRHLIDELKIYKLTAICK